MDTPKGFREINPEGQLAEMLPANAVGVKQNQTGRGFKADYQVAFADGSTRYYNRDWDSDSLFEVTRSGRRIMR